MTTDSRPTTLKLIDGSRDALERQAVRLAALGSNAELRAAVDRLMPRGKLTPVPSAGEPTTTPR